MVNARCAWGTCNSDRRYQHKDYMKGVKFFTFPRAVPDDPNHPNTIRCKAWVAACGRPSSQLNFDRVCKDIKKRIYHYRICSKHFVDGFPSTRNPVPIKAEPATRKTLISPEVSSAKRKRLIYRDELTDTDDSGLNLRVTRRQVYERKGWIKRQKTCGSQEITESVHTNSEDSITVQNPNNQGMVSTEVQEAETDSDETVPLDVPIPLVVTECKQEPCPNENLVKSEPYRADESNWSDCVLDLSKPNLEQKFTDIYPTEPFQIKQEKEWGDETLDLSLSRAKENSGFNEIEMPVHSNVPRPPIVWPNTSDVVQGMPSAYPVALFINPTDSTVPPNSYQQVNQNDIPPKTFQQSDQGRELRRRLSSKVQMKAKLAGEMETQRTQHRNYYDSQTEGRQFVVNNTPVTSSAEHIKPKEEHFVPFRAFESGSKMVSRLNEGDACANPPTPNVFNPALPSGYNLMQHQIRQLISAGRLTTSNQPDPNTGQFLPGSSQYLTNTGEIVSNLGPMAQTDSELISNSGQIMYPALGMMKILVPIIPVQYPVVTSNGPPVSVSVPQRSGTYTNSYSSNQQMIPTSYTPLRIPQPSYFSQAKPKQSHLGRRRSKHTERSHYDPPIRVPDISDVPLDLSLPPRVPPPAKPYISMRRPRNVLKKRPGLSPQVKDIVQNFIARKHGISTSADNVICLD